MRLAMSMGGLGREMIAALKAFQKDHGLRPSGIIDEGTKRLIDEKTGRESAPDAMVYVRQEGRDIYAGPVTLTLPDEPLGTHLYSFIDLDETSQAGKWTAMTLQSKGRLPGWSAAEWRQQYAAATAVEARDAVDRIQFPDGVRAIIEDLLTPGSSFIIADGGSERETGLLTDFVVLTD